MKTNKTNRPIKLFFPVIFILCLVPIIQSCYLSARHRAQQAELKEMVADAESAPTSDMQTASDGEGEKSRAGENDSDENNNGTKEMPDVPLNGNDTEESGAAKTDTEETWDAPVMLSKYIALYEENNDLVGWLSIEDMKIDYPVMQNEDDEYYLHHDFYGADSKYGCLYVREQADLSGGTNFIIYGHNMKDGSMFGDLDLYLKEDFYKEHSLIFFDTLYEERRYEILAVFRSQVYNADEDVFKYYQFYEADTREEFDDFYDNVKELSLYDTGVTAEFGDTFLTLSTCAYHVTDGRLVVVAKRVLTDLQPQADRPD
ncbi:MAG: class B sortase [Clostridium sp.]|nr:class B sortase [Acetatifactor muris]MCM1528066.1 class B sortase [Bacteroides sp.]MCM1564278.1 class B sortase [Clostridium sp.]